MLFLSARLMARYADKRDLHVLDAFDKLATVLPSPVAQHVHVVPPARRWSTDRLTLRMAAAFASGPYERSQWVTNVRRIVLRAHYS